MNGVPGIVAHWAGTLAEPLLALDARFAALAVVFQLGNLGFRALAWRNVLAAAYPGRRIPIVGVGAAYAAGVALNGFLPTRGGEAAKVALVRMQLPGTSVVSIGAAGAVVLVLDALLGGSLLVAAWTAGWLPAPPGAGVLSGVPATQPLGLAGGAVVVALGGWLAWNRLAARLLRDARRGVAVLATPRRYLRTVVAMQLGAWSCRLGAAFALLAAFGLHASLRLAALVVVLGGLSTLVPATPGGVGTQQVLVVYALHGATSAAAALSFSVGMQVAVTAVNTAIGLAAMMLVFRTVHPVSAVRAGLRASRRADGRRH